ncbi:hypothetical protein PACILC2_14820 [Paenibacillus cisolokensis]|uniref:DNA mismatch repair protein MutS connector domain-containing protein n=1 Tax=Paenibacillus cisolokensis TaxID=1658519 RepID=A0ABQ4N435_9BACL|nr:hypothetical protein PACILC2_14820 [Paenibacillus cisolokensis]
MRREIVRVVTPGTVMEAKSVSDKANNFIVSVAAGDGEYAVASCDLTTGELYVTSFAARDDMLLDEVNVYRPSEIVGDAGLLDKLQHSGAAAWNRPVLFTPREPIPRERLAAQFGEAELKRLPPVRLRAVSLLTGYLEETQKRSLGHVRTVRAYEPSQYMVLDHYTRRNLELTETVRDRSKKGSLLWLLDRTKRRWAPVCSAAGSTSRF